MSVRYSGGGGKEQFGICPAAMQVLPTRWNKRQDVREAAQRCVWKGRFVWMWCENKYGTNSEVSGVEVFQVCEGEKLAKMISYNSNKRTDGDKLSYIPINGYQAAQMKWNENSNNNDKKLLLIPSLLRWNFTLCVVW